MTNKDLSFIWEIENLILDAKEFDHIAHLRLGWLYLQESELKLARERICETIKRYAASLGADGKFNKTITCALMDIIDRRLKDEKCFKIFIQNNIDLQKNSLDLLLTKYNKERLFSEEARNEYLLPEAIFSNECEI